MQELYCFVPYSLLFNAILSVYNVNLHSTYIWQAKLIFFYFLESNHSPFRCQPSLICSPNITSLLWEYNIWLHLFFCCVTFAPLRGLLFIVSMDWWLEWFCARRVLDIVPVSKAHSSAIKWSESPKVSEFVCLFVFKYQTGKFGECVCACFYILVGSEYSHMGGDRNG